MHSPSASSSASSASSSSSSSSRIHPGSLVDSSLHSPALLELVELKIDRQIIDHLVDAVVDAVDYAMDRPPRRMTRGRSLHRNPELKNFTTFVTKVLHRAEVATPTVMVALAYIGRAKPYMHIQLEEWAHERVFLGALIVASKYTNDSTLKNVHWSMCTDLFGPRDIGRIEREFLEVLDYELGVSEADLMGVHSALYAAMSPPASQHHIPTHIQRHHNHHHRVPEMAPSSPSSSDDSVSSPQTPSTAVSMPHTPPTAVAESQPMHTDPMKSLLDSFPFVLPEKEHGHGPRHTRLDIPIQVDI